MNILKLREKFIVCFNKESIIVSSPGCANLIGEHTDYNNGFVLPAAIDKAVYFAIAPSKSDKCKLFAIDLNDNYEF